MNISNIMHKVLYIHSQFTQFSLKEVQAVALLKVSSWHFLGLELSIHPSIHPSISLTKSIFSAVQVCLTLLPSFRPSVHMTDLRQQFVQR